MAAKVLSHEGADGEPEYVHYQVRSETITRQIKQDKTRITQARKHAERDP